MLEAVGVEGYDATSVRTVIDRSGLYRQAFYDNFPDKDTCYLEAFEFGLERLEAAVLAAAAAEESWQGKLRAGLAALLEALDTEPDLGRGLIVEVHAAGKPVNGSRILILGVSYKAGVGDIRESPSLKIAKRLEALGGEISYHDPHVAELGELGLSSVELPAGLAGLDLAAIVTAHPEVDYEEVVAAAPLVVDFRGVTRGIEAANLVRL
jgi:AcrR family transcriptional regulator